MAIRSLANIWMVRSLLIVLMMMLTTVVEPKEEKVNLTGQREQDIELKLKQLNKQAVKSIENSNGEIIDCISITKQPAFDDPMLINHTIQMIPSSYPDEVFSDDNTSSPNNDEQQSEDTQLWQFPGDCPENTIPVRRITKEDLLRTNDIDNFGKKFSGANISQPNQVYSPPPPYEIGNGHEFALAYLRDGGIFRGAHAKINVWQSYVEYKGEYSESQIWVVGDRFVPGLNSLEVGSHVHPLLYGDANLRFFVYWTRDGYRKTGCYNHLCPGFVQTSRKIPLGALVKPLSTYGGPQYTMSVKVWKDPQTGNWWLQIGDYEPIGYWPSELFPNLRDSANMIKWGGEVLNLRKRVAHTKTQMGSGQDPYEGYGRSSFFKGVKYVDTSNVVRDAVGLQTFVNKGPCYNLDNIGYSKSWGVFFYYGGSGLNQRCQK